MKKRRSFSFLWISFWRKPINILYFLFILWSPKHVFLDTSCTLKLWSCILSGFLKKISKHGGPRKSWRTYFHVKLKKISTVRFLHFFQFWWLKCILCLLESLAPLVPLAPLVSSASLRSVMIKYGMVLWSKRLLYLNPKCCSHSHYVSHRP